MNYQTQVSINETIRRIKQKSLYNLSKSYQQLIKKYHLYIIQNVSSQIIQLSKIVIFCYISSGTAQDLIMKYIIHKETLNLKNKKFNLIGNR